MGCGLKPQHYYDVILNIRCHSMLVNSHTLSTKTVKNIALNRVVDAYSI